MMSVIVSYVVRLYDNTHSVEERSAKMQLMRPVARRSIQKEAQERIKEFILLNNLRPGDPLPTEAKLVEQLQVSRTVAREALRSLESLGVIHTQHGTGHYVSKFNMEPILQGLTYGMLFDYEDMREILEVREALEVTVIPMAIAAMNKKTLAELRRLVDRMLEIASKGNTFWEEDVAFHKAICAVTGNRLLIRLLDVFWEVLAHQRDQEAFTDHDPIRNARSHEELLRAIEAKDVTLARELIFQHMDTTRESLRRIETSSSD